MLQAAIRFSIWGDVIRAAMTDDPPRRTEPVSPLPAIFPVYREANGEHFAN